MNSTGLHIEDVDKGSQRPETSHEDKIVSHYLEARSEVYRDLVKVQDDVSGFVSLHGLGPVRWPFEQTWKNTRATAYFERQRRTADDPKQHDRRAFFFIMCGIGNEINGATGGALKLHISIARVLDLCMAPGGYTASTLKHSPHAVVCALTLPVYLGGHHVIHKRDPRVKVTFSDITMLYKEFGLTELPPNHPDLSKFSDKRLWHGKSFDLVICDGQVLRTHMRDIADYRRKVEAVRLTVSQLILAMQRIESGGTLIMLLHDVSAYETIKLLSVFDKIAEIQVFKPVSSHTNRGTFYLIAKNVQPRHPEAMLNGILDWKLSRGHDSLYVHE